MAVDVPKGKGQVVLQFIPHGLKEGTIAFLLGILSLRLLQCYSKEISILKKSVNSAS